MKSAPISTALSGRIWMHDNGNISVKIDGQRVAHVTPKNQTNLYDRLVVHLKARGTPLPRAKKPLGRAFKTPVRGQAN